MSPPLKVLLLENIHPGARDMLAIEGFDVEMVSSALKDDELLARLAGVSVLGIRSKTQVRANVLSQAKDLLTLGCFCIGTNQVDLLAAGKAGVAVFNAPFSNTRSVAEMILAEIVVLSRQLGDRSREVHAGIWKKVATSCFEIRGKTLGIIGYGHIGRQVGVLAEMFGMRVVFYDVMTKLPMGNNLSRATMDEVFAESDFVTLHVPETPQTKDMIGEAELASMRPGSYLLNASRGTVVVIPALAAALKGGHLAGAAIDVYPEEPESNGEGFASELRGLANVLLTPHIGGSTAEAQASIGREVATSIVKFVKAGATTGAVNFPPIEVPLEKGRGRILNVHRNVPGVMRDVSRVVAARDANIHAQVLSTNESIGYLMMDLDAAIAPVVAEDIKGLSTDIRTRVVYLYLRLCIDEVRLEGLAPLQTTGAQGRRCAHLPWESLRAKEGWRLPSLDSPAGGPLRPGLALAAPLRGDPCRSLDGRPRGEPGAGICAPAFGAGSRAWRCGGARDFGVVLRD